MKHTADLEGDYTFSWSAAVGIDGVLGEIRIPCCFWNRGNAQIKRDSAKAECSGRQELSRSCCRPGFAG